MNISLHPSNLPMASKQSKEIQRHMMSDDKNVIP